MVVLQRQMQQNNQTAPDGGGAAGEQMDDPVVKHFRRYLLNRCQNEFQREKDYEKEYECKKLIIEKSDVSTTFGFFKQFRS